MNRHRNPVRRLAILSFLSSLPVCLVGYLAKCRPMHPWFPTWGDPVKHLIISFIVMMILDPNALIEFQSFLGSKELKTSYPCQMTFDIQQNQQGSST